MLENSIKSLNLFEGYKPGASSCIDENGNLITDPQEVLKLWRKHFSTLLQGDDGVEVSKPSHKDVKVAIMRLENNKAADPESLPAELLKTECNES